MAAKTISRLNALLMLCLITFWGSSFVVVKITIQEGLTPISIATFRFLVASVMFLVALSLNRHMSRNYTLRVENKDLPKLLLLALTGVTFFFTIQYTGIQMASASIAAILVCLLSPILITVFSARMLKEHLKQRQKIGIGIATAGTIIVIAGTSLNIESSTTFFAGTLILLSTPVLWAAYTITAKKVMEKYSPFLVSAYVTTLGGLCLIPFATAENSIGRIATLSLQGWSAIVYLAFACSLLGYSIWLHVANQVKAAVVSSFMFAEPLITVLFATRFAGETITLSTAAGGFLIFIGVYLVSKKQTMLNHTRTLQESSSG
jgi:drug/metabolite transporter (DMT)-like permease